MAWLEVVLPGHDPSHRGYLLAEGSVLARRYQAWLESRPEAPREETPVFKQGTGPRGRVCFNEGGAKFIPGEMEVDEAGAAGAQNLPPSQESGSGTELPSQKEELQQSMQQSVQQMQQQSMQQMQQIQWTMQQSMQQMQEAMQQNMQQQMQQSIQAMQLQMQQDLQSARSAQQPHAGEGQRAEEETQPAEGLPTAERAGTPAQSYQCTACQTVNPAGELCTGCHAVRMARAEAEEGNVTQESSRSGTTQRPLSDGEDMERDPKRRCDAASRAAGKGGSVRPEAPLGPEDSPHLETEGATQFFGMGENTGGNMPVDCDAAAIDNLSVLHSRYQAFSVWKVLDPLLDRLGRSRPGLDLVAGTDKSWDDDLAHLQEVYLDERLPGEDREKVRLGHAQLSQKQDSPIIDLEGEGRHGSC